MREGGDESRSRSRSRSSLATYISPGLYQSLSLSLSLANKRTVKLFNERSERLAPRGILSRIADGRVYARVHTLECYNSQEACALVKSVPCFTFRRNKAPERRDSFIRLRDLPQLFSE